MKIYTLALPLISIFFVGCTSKDVIPPPPKSQIKERTPKELNQKLKLIQKKLGGTYLSHQRREASKEINSILHDGKKYKSDLARFEKAHPYKPKKKKKHIQVKEKKEEVKNEKSRLKFY